MHGKLEFETIIVELVKDRFKDLTKQCVGVKLGDVIVATNMFSPHDPNTPPLGQPECTEHYIARVQGIAKCQGRDTGETEAIAKEFLDKLCQESEVYLHVEGEYRLNKEGSLYKRADELLKKEK